MKTSLVLRHVPFEDLGLLAPVLQQRGYSVRTHDAGVGPLEDSLHPEPDLLVVLGGPIGAFDETAYPFLADTLALLRERLARRLPVLGICLGAQLMARALGAGVAPMGHKEIGFAPLALTPGGERSVLAPWPRARRCCTGMATSSKYHPAPKTWPPRPCARTRPLPWARMRSPCSSTWKRTSRASSSGWWAMPASWLRPA